MNITEHFTWEELVFSHTANMHNIRNTPGREERQALEELVKRLLQPLRMAFGGPVRITSGYRCAALNKRVGGVPSSLHVKGQAADCVVRGNASRLLGALLLHELPFDQAILYRKQNYLHLSLRPERNRYRIILND